MYCAAADTWHLATNLATAQPNKPSAVRRAYSIGPCRSVAHCLWEQDQRALGVEYRPRQIKGNPDSAIGPTRPRPASSPALISSQALPLHILDPASVCHVQVEGHTNAGEPGP